MIKVIKFNTIKNNSHCLLKGAKVYCLARQIAGPESELGI